MIYKNRDIEAVVNERGVNLGDIDVVFYTKDINTTSFRLFLKHKIEYANETVYDIFDLRNKGLTPYIDLMMEDGSIFTREPMEIIEADAGLIQYNIPNDILLHIGKVEASVYLLSDGNEKDEGIEVAQFYFYIDDNGLTSRVRRVVNTPIVDEAVARVLSKDAQKLLDNRYKANLESSLRSYLFENADRFKGPQGDEGPQGPAGGFDEERVKEIQSEYLDRLKKVATGISILDYPRLKDEQDDRLRFQRAIDDLASKNGGTLIIPKTEEAYIFKSFENPTVYNPCRVKIVTNNINIVGIDNPTIKMQGITKGYLESIDDISSSGRDFFTVFAFIGTENCTVSGINFVGEWDGKGYFRYCLLYTSDAADE